MKMLKAHALLHCSELLVLLLLMMQLSAKEREMSPVWTEVLVYCITEQQIYSSN